MWTQSIIPSSVPAWEWWGRVGWWWLLTSFCSVQITYVNPPPPHLPGHPEPTVSKRPYPKPLKITFLVFFCSFSLPVLTIGRWYYSMTTHYTPYNLHSLRFPRSTWNPLNHATLCTGSKIFHNNSTLWVHGVIFIAKVGFPLAVSWLIPLTFWWGWWSSWM